MTDTVYIAGRPEAEKDNKERMETLDNLLKINGYATTGRRETAPLLNMHVHLSERLIDKLSPKGYTQQAGTKPNGFWYSYGTEWIDELSASKNLKDGYIYKVDINNLNILQIKTEFELSNFTREYGLNNPSNTFTKTYIDWVRVARKYDGVEINLPIFPNYTNSPELLWLYGWDIASGCVWNLDRIKIELIGTLKNNVIKIQDNATKLEQKEPWKMTREEFRQTAKPLHQREDFMKAWLKDNEDIPNKVSPGINHIFVSNGELLVYGNERGNAVGVVSIYKKAIHHIAVLDNYQNKGIATQLVRESRKYGARDISGDVSPEFVGIAHKFLVGTAFLEGKPVPPAVLREYPDLIAKADKQKWRRTV